MYQVYSEGFYFSRRVNLSGRFVTCNDGSAGSLTQPVSLGGQGEEESGLELWVQRNQAQFHHTTDLCATPIISKCGC